MKTYKNTTANFETKESYTQILFAQGDAKPEGYNWIEQKDEEFEIEMDFVYDVKHLYTQAGIRYFGWL